MFLNKIVRALSTRTKKVLSVATALTFIAAGLQAPAAQAATATINNVSFKAPVFDSYDHATGGGVWNDGSVTYDKGELLGTNYKCGDWASFLLELNTSATPTKQPAPYKAEIKLTYTRDTTGQSGVSLNPSTDPAHLRVNTGVIKNTLTNTVVGTGTGGRDGGFNDAGTSATVATSPAPALSDNGKSEFVSGATQTVTFTVQGIAAAANIIIRSDAQIHCKAGSSPTGNLQATLTSVVVTYPGTAETVSAGNQTVNFRGAGDIAGASSPLMTMTKGISANGTDCNTVVSTKNYIIPSGSQSILYCYSVTNNGTATAYNVTMTDDNATSSTSDDFQVALYSSYASALSNTSGNLKSSLVASPYGAQVTGGGTTLYGTSNYKISSGVITAQNLTLNSGSYSRTNIATTRGTTGALTTDTALPVITAQATAIVTGSTSHLTVTKSITTSATSYFVGDTIGYSITALNDGIDTLTAVTIDDRLAGISALNCTWPGTSGTLNANQSVTCTGTYVVQQTDLDNSGKVDNYAVVTATGPSSTTVTANSNTVSSPVIARIYAATITKVQTSADPMIVGDVISYDVRATNTGNSDLAGFYIEDSIRGAAFVGTVSGCGSASPITLAVGATLLCQVTVTIDSTYLAAGNVLNTASTHSTSPGFVSASASANTPIGADPELTLTKTQTSTRAPMAVGDTIDYRIDVTNTGNVTLTNVTVVDAGTTISGCTNPYPSLAVNATYSCVATHAVTAAELTAGQVLNTATATGTYNSTTTSATSNTVTTLAALSIVKSRVGTPSLTKPGDVVNYSIVVTNTGNVTLTNVQVTDANAVISSCSPALGSSLYVGDAMTCSASHAVTANEVSAGQTVNTAAVTTAEITAAINSNTVTTPIVVPAPVSSLAVTKALSGAAPAKVGDSVNYTITVTNNGETALTGVNVTDANAVLGACSVALPATLAVGASLTCAATHVVTDADMAAGKVDNVAVASATTGSLSRSSNVVTVPLIPAAALSIVKSLAGTAPSKVGETINYSIVVTNTGNVTVSALTVADTNATLGTCTPATPATLAPGASVTCAATHVITVADMLAGKVDNVATAQGTALGAPVAGSSSQSNSPAALNVTSNVVTVPLAYAPAISITKHVTGSLPTTIGGFLHYIIVVVNTGNVALHDVAIADGNATITSCSVDMPVAELAVGDRVTCSAKHALTEADALAGKVVNVASVTTKENATASSGSDATTGASAGDPATVNKSNEVVTPIVFEKQSIGKGTKSGTIVLKLGGTALKNPKLKQLAFTGGEEPATSDYGFFLALLALIAAAFGARRWAKR